MIRIHSVIRQSDDHCNAGCMFKQSIIKEKYYRTVLEAFKILNQWISATTNDCWCCEYRTSPACEIRLIKILSRFFHSDVATFFIRIEIKTYAVSHYCIGVWYGLMVWLIQQQSSSDAKQNRPKISSLPFFHFHTFKSIIFKYNITFSVKVGFYIFTVIIYYALLNHDLIILESFQFICDVHF